MRRFDPNTVQNGHIYSTMKEYKVFISSFSVGYAEDFSYEPRGLRQCVSFLYTIQYNDLLTTPHGGFSVTIQLREITMVSKKTKISSKTLYYVCMYV